MAGEVVELYQAMVGELGPTIMMTYYEKVGEKYQVAQRYQDDAVVSTFGNKKVLVVNSINKVISPVAQQIQSSVGGAKVYIFNNSLALYRFTAVCEGNTAYLTSLTKLFTELGGKAIANNLIARVQIGQYDLYGYIKDFQITINSRALTYYGLTWSLLGWEA